MILNVMKNYFAFAQKGDNVLIRFIRCGLIGHVIISDSSLSLLLNLGLSLAIL